MKYSLSDEILCIEDSQSMLKSQQEQLPRHQNSIEGAILNRDGASPRFKHHGRLEIHLALPRVSTDSQLAEAHGKLINNTNTLIQLGSRAVLSRRGENAGQNSRVGS